MKGLSLSAMIVDCWRCGFDSLVWNADPIRPSLCRSLSPSLSPLDHSVRKYTAVVENVDLNRLKTCAGSAEVGYPGLAELYFRITGDAAGQDGEGSKVSEKMWEDGPGRVVQRHATPVFVLKSIKFRQVSWRWMAQDFWNWDNARVPVWQPVSLGRFGRWIEVKYFAGNCMALLKSELGSKAKL